MSSKVECMKEHLLEVLLCNSKFEVIRLFNALCKKNVETFSILDAKRTEPNSRASLVLYNIFRR